MATQFTQSMIPLSVISALSLVLGTISTPVEAATVTQNQTVFLNELAQGFYLETFDALPRFPTFVPTPQPFSGSGFSYYASAERGFANVGSVNDVWLSANFSNTPIVFTFTSGNVTAVGGAFFQTNLGGEEVVLGTITIALSNGTSVNLTNPTNSSFLGFTSPGAPIASLKFTPGVNTWATVNNLYVGQAIPAPALLPGLVGLGVAVLRKRKAEG